MRQLCWNDLGAAERAEALARPNERSSHHLQAAVKSIVNAVHAVCQESVFWETLQKLKAVGASAILVLPIEKMMM